MCRCQTFPDFNTGNKKQVFKKNLDRKLKDEEDGQVKLYKKSITLKTLPAITRLIWSGFQMSPGLELKPFKQYVFFT